MTALATEAANHLSVWRDYKSIVTDPAHILAELTMMLVFDVIIGALLIPFIRDAVRRHDRSTHDIKETDAVL